MLNDWLFISSNFHDVVEVVLHEKLELYNISKINLWNALVLIWLSLVLGAMYIWRITFRSSLLFILMQPLMHMESCWSICFRRCFIWFSSYKNQLVSFSLECGSPIKRKSDNDYSQVLVEEKHYAPALGLWKIAAPSGYCLVSCIEQIASTFSHLAYSLEYSSSGRLRMNDMPNVKGIEESQKSRRNYIWREGTDKEIQFMESIQPAEILAQ